MEKKSIFKMVKHISTNAGFTLVSVLLTLMIVSTFLLLIINNYVEFDDNYLKLMNDSLTLQTDSIVNRCDNYLDDYSIHYNNKGHINISQSINFTNHKVIFHLGNGYNTYE